MAAMDQAKLSSMCSNVNSAAGQYVSGVNSDVEKLTDAFNQAWVSQSSKQEAVKITTTLSQLAQGIQSVFASKNEDIANHVSAFNSLENESISYQGFTFGTPNVTVTLNATLPNGKVGVADGASIEAITNPFDTLVANVETNLNQVSSSVKSSDAFDDKEQAAMTSGIEKTVTNFVNAMAQIKQSVRQAFQQEEQTRTSYDATAESNLSSTTDVTVE